MRLWKVFAGCGAIVGALGGGVGCGLSCTMMYAPSTLVVNVDSDALEPGWYAYELQGYTQHAMCVLQLPQTEPGSEMCTTNLFLTVSEDGTRVEELTAWEFHPPTVTISVRRQATELAEVATAQFTPDYAISEPNGAGCGERYAATVDFAF